MGCESQPITATDGLRHRRSYTLTFGFPTSSTPGRTPHAFRSASVSSGSCSMRARSRSVRGVASSANPSMATSPCSSTSDAITFASASAGSGTAPPAMPLCTGPSSARRDTSTPAMPRSEYVIPGTPTFQLLASARTRTSAASSSRCFVRNASRRGEPISSSPSTSTRTLHGSSPTVRSQAATVAACATAPALSSAVPRPYRRPLRSRGSNGGDVQLSTMPGGCTSWCA